MRHRFYNLLPGLDLEKWQRTDEVLSFKVRNTCGKEHISQALPEVVNGVSCKAVLCIIWVQESRHWRLSAPIPSRHHVSQGGTHQARWRMDQLEVRRRR
jgi:hypothetical protein